jgi:glycosyltransferase involved in cell wall biosynthesis
VITPCFNEAKNIRDCVEAVRYQLEDKSFEHILIDNASTDDSISVLSALKEEFPHVRVLTNSHNVGVFSSIQRALGEVRTEWVVPFFAADLQDPPEVIKGMVELQRETGSDSVFGIRSNRSEPKYMSIMRKVFYGFLRSATRGSYVIGTSEFCLIRFEVIRQLLQLNDPNPFFRIYLSQLRGNVKYLTFNMQSRTKGKSSATFFSLMDDALNGLTLVLPSVFSRILFGSFIFLSIGLALIIYSLIDIAFLPSSLEQLFPIGITLTGFAFLIGLVAVVGHYVYLVHSSVRAKIFARTSELD